MPFLTVALDHSYCSLLLPGDLRSIPGDEPNATLAAGLDAARLMIEKKTFALPLHSNTVPLSSAVLTTAVAQMCRASRLTLITSPPAWLPYLPRLAPSLLLKLSTQLFPVRTVAATCLRPLPVLLLLFSCAPFDVSTRQYARPPLRWTLT